MIRYFYRHQSTSHSTEMNKMLQLRYKVFHKRLNWNVDTVENMEIDVFDELDPLYVVHLDEHQNVLGSFRLLQTTGPTMLRNVFNRCLPEHLDIRSPTVWESTRFCVDTDLAIKRGSNGLTWVTGSLLSALIEIGTKAGLTHIVTVIDVRMERILKRAHCPVERLGDPVDYGGCQTLAILMECSEYWSNKIQMKNGLAGNTIHKQNII